MESSEKLRFLGQAIRLVVSLCLTKMPDGLDYIKQVGELCEQKGALELILIVACCLTMGLDPPVPVIFLKIFTHKTSNCRMDTVEAIAMSLEETQIQEYELHVSGSVACCVVP